MEHTHPESPTTGTEAFVAELQHWRQAAGISKKELARLVNFDPSYVSKVESGTLTPSRSFAEAADQHLHAGRVLVRRWTQTCDKQTFETTRASTFTTPSERVPGPENDVVIEHEIAELTHREEVYRTQVRRLLRNVGPLPVTQYLVRIAVDRYPGDPERSNRLYRESPLTWEEIGLAARCGDEPMHWRVKHDRDASKEVWLLFENHEGRFPVYPGETVWFEYSYAVDTRKWGPWWQRAIRVPTHRLSLTLDLPTEYGPAVWGLETSMTAEASPVHTAISREQREGRTVFTWATDQPSLHARYRLEWKFKADTSDTREEEPTTPSRRMQALGIAQDGEPALREDAKPFALPEEAEDARRVVSQLVATLERIGKVHRFAKGMGLAAPQAYIRRRAAVVRTPDGETVTLLNPRIINESPETDEQYEGCLSFFDVRGVVPRPIAIEVEHQEPDGTTRITRFEEGVARLVQHEIDHLDGRLYRERMRPTDALIPVSQYAGTGQRWNYHSAPEGVGRQ